MEPLARSFIGGEHKMLVGGAWVAPRGGESLVVEDPATGKPVTRIAAGDGRDLDLAVAAARRAFDQGPWPTMSGLERAGYLLKLADLVEANAGELSLIEAIDVGQPITLARHANINAAVTILRYASGWAGRIYGDTIPAGANGDWHIYTLREPCGVVGQIVPWNVPFSMAVSKMASALAAGCCVIIKPAELTSLSTLRLGQLVEQAGVPEGVVNIVTGAGPDIGAAMVSHRGIDKIAFTGSTETGKSILKDAASTLKRVTLELGGKAPVLILRDADIDKAVAATAGGIFFNSGQTCTAGSRVLVDPSIAAEVAEKLTARAQEIKVGSPLDPVTQMGPLVSRRQQERVESYIASGIEEGAELLAGGERIASDGYFCAPTIFRHARPSMRMVREEIFGPVLTLIEMDSDALDDLAREANDTEYGLSASIWTRDISKGHRLARKIKAGSVRINTSGNIDPAVPFGGYKHSGFGRERGREGVELYTELKAITVAL